MKRLSYLYLILPFILFLFGWVRLTIAIPLAVIIFFALWQLLKESPLTPSSLFTHHWSLNTAYWLLLTVLWLFLSGIGGYAFQNWDHNWRNVVMRDLMNFNWPVYYAQPESGPVKMLVYYVGYWLPSALTGKLLNWRAANSFLFLWTFLGIILITYNLGSIFKTSKFKATLLLIFFSGLDVLGVLFFPQDYPTLLPPITHLEIWAGNLQYSSFTTQLFWVFNQAIPAWLIITLIVILSREAAKQSSKSLEIASGKEQRRPRNDELILLWSLCFFFAPFASVGLLPYVLIELIKQTDFKSPFKNLHWEQIAAALIIFLLSALFFTANTAAQSRGFQSLPLTKYLAFFLLEGGILWLMLAPSKYKDPRWIVTGVLLAVIPFIQIGNDRDFVMRASIAPLFYLMLMTGETLFEKTVIRVSLITRYSLVALLVLGAFTPIYEINRSIYRTYDYYFLQDSCSACDFSSDPITQLAHPDVPEKEHPGTLTADALPTLKFMTDELSRNFIANVRQTFFYKYLASR
ncbi:MAG: hypothetical protein H6634_07640 [Anaerolineales bacterium]|nr:hypothetical protein [Anaerolineales bacterium]